MADSSAIDRALVAKLGSDPALLALMPNGVHMNTAFQGATRFVVVAVLSDRDEPAFGGRSFEDAIYLVKAVGLNTANPDMAAAAARIDELLEGQTIDAAGYSCMTMRRVERVRYTEPDDIDRAVEWFHRGGQYQIVMSL